ncbi:MAG: rRNA maturation RNase YbeY [Bacteroidia bacterium]|nr:rRNA maturation RNase YbeY [Bacteroidia bacterium]
MGSYILEVAGWIAGVAASHGKKAGEINYVFCSDSKMLEHNKNFLEHDFYTDIITFDYSKDSIISGDIYIGTDTVASNAALLGLSVEQELFRVIIHGVLHLCGFKDKSPKDEVVMHEQEDIALSYL